MSARTLDGNPRGPDVPQQARSSNPTKGAVLVGGSIGLRAWHAVRVLSGPPPSPTVPVVSWRRANSAETAGFARWKLVSGLVLDGETPVCAAVSLPAKFRFPAAFECPIGDWFESYEPSSLRCLRDGFDVTACLARSSSPLRSTTHYRATGDFLKPRK
jgi:hypothetical protein